MKIKYAKEKNDPIVTLILEQKGRFTLRKIQSNSASLLLTQSKEDVDNFVVSLSAELPTLARMFFHMVF